MKYCKCETPQEITSQAGGSTFKVCTKSKGGCGKEIVEREWKREYLIEIPDGLNYIGEDCSKNTFKLDKDLLDNMPGNFKDFLVRHQALEKYMDNFSRTISKNKLSKNKFFNTAIESRFISAAFVYLDSKEGTDYWINLSNLWQQEINI